MFGKRETQERSLRLVRESQPPAMGRPRARIKQVVVAFWGTIAIATYSALHEIMLEQRAGLNGYTLSFSRWLIPFSIVGIISWGVWLTRWLASRRYRPLAPGFRLSTSVLVPSFREDPEVLSRCLRTWLAEDPEEVILVVDVDDEEVLDMLERTYGDDPRVQVVPFKHDGKRSAMGVALRRARCEVVVFTDSDTAWEPGLLAAALAPFEDPRVGGVGTRQNVYIRESSVWRILADWQVNTRYLDYVPAESMAGGVACLSGRTAAYRRQAVLPNVEDLENEYFLGRKCVAGDDGRLTWLVLKDGWRTVYQSNARATSMFPNSGKAYFKQRLRWSRNSYRCYLTAAFRGWLWQQPIVTQVRVLQILLTPVTQSFTLFFIGWSLWHMAWLLAALGVAWLFLSRLVRSSSHLSEYPRDIRYLPAVTLAIIAVALPVKIYAFFTMNKHGWLTRKADRVGGEGQSESSLAVPGAAA